MAALKLARKSRRVRNARGAELIEFALVLPLLLLLVLGIVDFGFLFQRLEVVTNAAREGARIAVLPSYTTDDVKARVNDYLTRGGVPIVAGTNPTINVTKVNPTLTPGGAAIPSEQVVVTYSHTYLFLSGVARFFGGNFTTVPLRGQATMTIEAGGS